MTGKSEAEGKPHDFKQGGTGRAQAIGWLTGSVLNVLHEMEATISLTGHRKPGSGTSAGRRESLQERWMGRSKAYGRRKPRRRVRAGQKTLMRPLCSDGPQPVRTQRGVINN